MDTQLGVIRLQKEDVPMGKPRRKHSLEFKLEAVKQVVEQGRSVSEVADGLGVNRNLLTRWKSLYSSAGAVTATPVDQEQRDLEAENRRLRRELSIARQERDILKKATAYFAKESS